MYSVFRWAVFAAVRKSIFGRTQSAGYSGARRPRKAGQWLSRLSIAAVATGGKGSAILDIKALFKIQCGLYVAAVGTPEKLNGCITNTLMQQSHVPVKMTVTIEKSHLTHDMIMEKRTLGISALAAGVSPELIKRFGFQSGREVDKFAGFSDYVLDGNGNPLLSGGQVAATFSLRVYDTVDFGTHTMFLCTPDASEALDGAPITYWDYRESLKK